MAPFPHRSLVFAALVLTMFTAAMEMTVISTAMPTVVGDLGGLHYYSWVFTAYMVLSTVTVPLYGKLADLIGRKPVILFGISVFLVGSAACGLARTMEQLVVFRAVQGLGAGAMQPIVLTIIGDMYTLEERARVQGITGAVWGLSGIAGPALGGVIVKHLSWHWVFLINIPVGIVALVILSAFLREKVERRSHALDLLGALWLTVAVLLMLAASDATLPPLAALGGAAVMLLLFVRQERRAPEPLWPLDLFSQRVIVTSSLGGALLGAVMFGTVSFIPLFVQGVQGGSPTDAGSTITPMVIGWPIASTLAGHLIPRWGFRPIARAGFTTAAVASVAMAAFIHGGVNPWVIRGLAALLGAGLGFANTSLLIAVQTSVEWKRRGVATASTMFFRTIGGTLAVGLMGGVLSAALAAHPEVPAAAVEQLLGPHHGRDLATDTLRVLSGALGDGLATVFLINALLGVGAFVVGMLFPHTELKDVDPAAGGAAH